MDSKKRIKLGQNIMEYTVIIAIVVTALMIMQVYLKRGIQAATKAAADQLSSQSTPEIINLEKGGYLIGSNAFSQANSGSQVITKFRERSQPDLGMNMETEVNYTTNTISNSVYNLGNVSAGD